MKLAFAAVAAAFAAVALAGPAAASPAEDIITKEKCHKCHQEKTSKKGPSWASLAEKYKGKADAPDKLFNELKKGGKVGDEEDHLQIKAPDDVIKSIVQIVLTSK